MYIHMFIRMYLETAASYEGELFGMSLMKILFKHVVRLEIFLILF